MPHDLTSSPNETIFLCSCEGSFTPDVAACRAVAPDNAQIVTCSMLCGQDKHLLTTQAQTSTTLTIACKQEETRLLEVLETAHFTGDVRFFDLRDRAGWSSEGGKAGAKMAALLAAARLPAAQAPFVTLQSQGVAVLYGQDESVFTLAEALSSSLDITVLLAAPKADILLPSRYDFPVVIGQIRAAKGYLGAFSLEVEGLSVMRPSSRFKPEAGQGITPSLLHCDLLIDVSGAPPLFPAFEARDGYLRADPAAPASWFNLVKTAQNLVGTFDKPRYIQLESAACAHSRSRKIGCHRCLDVCPTGAITPKGDHVVIDPFICAGCGSCAALCPNDAARYTWPESADVFKILRVMLKTYIQAGGKHAQILFYNDKHGEAVINALARWGEGLPACVLPVPLSGVARLSLGEIAAAFAYGAAGVLILVDPLADHAHEARTQIEAQIRPFLHAFGYEEASFTTLVTQDPEDLRTALVAQAAAQRQAIKAVDFMPMGKKRELTIGLLHAWREAVEGQEKPQESGGVPQIIPLPQAAPFGTLHINEKACTLCFACVSACPQAALNTVDTHPALRFTENLCTQCGLCTATCPEKALELVPRFSFAARLAPAQILKQEEAYPCEKCGTLFGTRAMVEKIRAQLAGKHWMFQAGDSLSQNRLKWIGYCEKCRVFAASDAGFDPHNAQERPKPRTS